MLSFNYRMKPSIELGLLILSIYLWKKYFQLRKRYRRATEEESFKEKCHNTVVIYSKIKGITGWPGYETDPYQINFKELRRIFEPVTHFIGTAERTLDIAVMLMNSSILTNTVLTALEKGIKIRIILNYGHSENSSVQKLVKHGANITFFVEPPNVSSIFHYKYAIKDYGTHNQAVYCGSLNWTDTAFSSNYEDLTFSTNKYIVNCFHENFVNALDYLKSSNEGSEDIKQLIRNLRA